MHPIVTNRPMPLKKLIVIPLNSRCRLLLLIFWLPMITATLEITNYTDAHTITIHKGIGKIQSASIKMIHLINLKQIEEELFNIREHTVNDLKKSYLYHTLTHEITQAFSALNTLTFKNHNKRSINWIGSAWKYVAGNPDNDDLAMTENNINNLITNNNEQIIINQQLQTRINSLTTVSNMLKNSIRKDSSFNNEIATSLQNQVRLLKEELINVKYAMQWARLNIINTLLLSDTELAEVHETFKRGNITSLSVEEMLELVDVSVLHNKTTIAYIIKIPELEPITYQNILVKPVLRNNSIIHLEANEIFLYKDILLKTPENCKLSKNIKICKNKTLLT